MISNSNNDNHDDDRNNTNDSNDNKDNSNIFIISIHEHFFWLKADEESNL